MQERRAVLSVKFDSKHSAEKLITICHEDLDSFRKVSGLLQKYYISEERTGAISGLYLFETKSARTAFLTSELAANIPARYGVIPDSLRVEEYDMMIQLHGTTSKAYNAPKGQPLI